MTNLAQPWLLQAHKRRFEQFRQLSVDAGPRSDAWELVRAILSTSNVEGAETQELSKRTLKRVRPPFFASMKF